MIRAEFKTKHLAGKVEGDYLPAPVAKELASADDTAQHLIDTLSGLAFSVNFLICLVDCADAVRRA